MKPSNGDDKSSIIKEKGEKEEQSVLVEKEENGVVHVITINRPHRRNAVDRPTAQKLATAFRQFEADPVARVAVLCGAGGNFCR